MDSEQALRDTRAQLRRQVRSWQKAADRDDQEPGGLEVAIGELNKALAEMPRRMERHLVHETPRERCEARNSALAVARGRYVAYLDDDDLFHPEHLETLVTELQRTGLRVAYSDGRRVFRGGGRDGESDVPYSVDFSRDRLVYENYIPIINVVHERACLERTGPFDPQMSPLEDWELWVRLSRHDDFLHVPVVTATFEERLDGTRPSFTPAALRLFAKHRGLVDGRPDLGRLRVGYLAGLRQLDSAAGRPAVTIVIPIYDRLELTRQCLAAIQLTARPGYSEVVVVDNASTDRTDTYLRAEQAAVGSAAC